jgi:hypothetical protein
VLVLRLALLIATACGRPTPAEPSPPPAVAPAPAADAASADGEVVAAAPDAAPRPPSPSPPTYTHRILSVRLVGVELELVVDGGARDGIRTDWAATLVDAGDHVLGVKLRIAAVADDRTIVMARATRDQILDKRVRLAPPN